MMLIGRILRGWSRAGISTLEAARQEHESHIQGIAAKSAGFADGSKAGRYAALYAGRTPRNIQRCRREF